MAKKIVGRAQSVFSIYLQDLREKIKLVMLIPEQSNIHKSEGSWMAVCHGNRRQHISLVLMIFIIKLQLYTIF